MHSPPLTMLCDVTTSAEDHITLLTLQKKTKISLFTFLLTADKKNKVKIDN